MGVGGWWSKTLRGGAGSECFMANKKMANDG